RKKRTTSEVVPGDKGASATTSVEAVRSVGPTAPTPSAGTSGSSSVLNTAVAGGEEAAAAVIGI
ncbi:hypothetical protein NDU88_007422, partial [Pleurodeles waltl]